MIREVPPDTELARLARCNRSTIRRWKTTKPELYEALVQYTWRKIDKQEQQL